MICASELPIESSNSQLSGLTTTYNIVAKLLTTAWYTSSFLEHVSVWLCVLVPDDEKTWMTQRQAAALLACVVFCLSRLRVSNTAPAFCAFTPIRRSAQRKTQAKYLWACRNDVALMSTWSSVSEESFNICCIRDMRSWGGNEFVPQSCVLCKWC